MLHLSEMLAEFLRESLTLPPQEYDERRRWTIDIDDGHYYGQAWKSKHWDRTEGCLEALAREPMDEPVEMDEIAWYLRGLCPKLFNDDGSRTEMTFAEACSNA
jgi:hypothetical protein